MRLVTAALLLSFIIIEVRSQNHFRHDHFPYLPQFQTPGPGVFSTDKTLYLPPENHNALPYFPMKNPNLPFPLLPPTGTKAPSIYPSPYPLIMSSTMIPNFEDDDDDDRDNIRTDQIHFSSIKPPHTNQNQSNPEQNQSNKKEGRTLPKTVQYRHPIDRADMKFPIHLGTMPTPGNQTPSNRRMIVTAEMSRSDQSPDQVKAGSFQGPQFINAPPGYLQSTTEPAIPILRLSNEMDLDGSFSYEALGADQTHYVQHSRMENMGSDKEEQVVEGSYSYVGDNGQTYTVHYVADSNGFRASGDHLPVPPPVPEIIQRAIQYNLEEEKKPPHLRRWHEDENEQNNNNNRDHNREPNHIFNLPPPRNLFTGKTPEAFSHSYSQQQQHQQQQQENNLLASASNHAPVKTVDYNQEQSQSKPQNNAPIAPQITFLASQGAHVPGANAPQQSISRMFSSLNEKPLPQIMNYEANLDSEEANKALWRWQYGINAYNSNLNKNFISRSSSDDDNVMINFNDMTQEQYSQMINSQTDRSTELNKIETTQYPYNPYKEENQYTTPQNIGKKNNQEQHNLKPIDLTTPQSAKQVAVTGSSVSFPHSNDWYNKEYLLNKNQIVQSSTEIAKENESRKFMMSEPYSKIITQKHFNLPTSQTVTQSYDYENNVYEPRKLKSYSPSNDIVNIDKVKATSTEKPVEIKNHSNSGTDYENWKQKSELYSDQYDDEDVKTTTQVSFSSAIPDISTEFKSGFKFSDFIVNDDKDSFKPITTTTRIPEVKEMITTTTEESVEEILNNNIFLKNLLKNDNTMIGAPKKEQNHEQFQENKVKAQPKSDKIPKYIHSKPINEIKIIKKKPLDVSDVLNYVAMKNHFEPSKIRPKSQMHPLEQYKTRNEKYYQMPDEKQRHEKEQHEYNEKLKQYQHQDRELQGIIKNYKVLQRNNNMMQQHHAQNEPNPLYFPSQQNMQLSNLPPLGRAGPTVKAYLPPIYV